MTASVDLLKTLGIPAGARMLLINAPVEFAEAITAGAEVEPVMLGEDCTGVLAFCDSQTEADSFAKQALPTLQADPVVWFAYRPEEVPEWSVLKAAGYREDHSTELDDGWAATRFGREEGGAPSS